MRENYVNRAGTTFDANNHEVVFAEDMNDIVEEILNLKDFFVYLATISGTVATGTQTIAHNKGKVPVRARIFSIAGDSASTFRHGICSSTHFFANGSNFTNFIALSNTSTSVGGITSDFAIIHYRTTDINNSINATLSADANNLYIHWVKWGSGISTPIQLRLELDF